MDMSHQQNMLKEIDLVKYTGFEDEFGKDRSQLVSKVMIMILLVKREGNHGSKILKKKDLCPNDV